MKDERGSKGSLSVTVENNDQVRKIVSDMGYPVKLIPNTTIGGFREEVIVDEEEFDECLSLRLSATPENPLTIEPWS